MDSNRWNFRTFRAVCLTLTLVIAAASIIEGETLDYDEDYIDVDEVEDARDIRPESESTIRMQWNALPSHLMRACRTASSQRPLLVVSTMDGKISALDISDGGNLQWSLDPGIGPLLSSTLSHVDEDENVGSLFKFIPDLDGNLYAWDGKNLELAPFNTDSLLSSSFKLGDDLMVVGSKETRTYGINAHTGQLHYICSAVGCQQYGEQPKEAEDVIILKFKQQTVRAMDVRSGIEKWNYSVGQHNIKYVEGSVQAYEDPDYMNSESCRLQEDELIEVDRIPRFKVLLDSKMFSAVSHTDFRQELWHHKFPTEIATAWTVVDGDVEQLDLLSVDVNPAVPPDDRLIPYHGPQIQPPFIAIYEKQLYIRPSAELRRQIQDSTTTTPLPYLEDKSPHSTGFPRLHWRPYISSAPSRTPFIGPLKNRENGVKGAHSPVWNQYPFDGGYSLPKEKVCQVPLLPFTKEKKPENAIDNKSAMKDEAELHILLGFSLWTWWREMLLSSIVLAVIWQLLYNKVLKKTCESISTLDNAQAEVVVAEEAGVFEDVQAIIMKDPEKEDFKSRYLSDFEHQECLGKGGFGIVFQAKNKVDESSYAIKRITLPRREDAREKVLREARALARLEHIGIVRYFQSWIEEPPPGWQEENDRKLLGEMDYGNSPLNSILSTTTFNKDSELVRNKKKFLRQTSSDPKISSNIQGFGGGSGNYAERSRVDEGSVSVGFSVGSDDTSGAFSVEFDEDVDFDGNHPNNETLKLADFEPNFDDTSSEPQEKLDIPFRRYNDDFSNSIDIVFEHSENRDTGEDISNQRQLSDKNSTSESKRNNLKIDEMSAELNEKERPETLSAINIKNRASDKKFEMVIPRVYLYIQMQLCRKDTLKDWLVSHVERDRNRLLHIFQEILGAVDYVHGCGMIHRDLKPSNIFFSMDGSVKVGDFGLVTAMDTEVEICDLEDEVADDSNNHTSQVGTHLYMSPEQVAGHSYDHKIDMYSLGLILFELLQAFSTQMERISVMTRVKDHGFPATFSEQLPVEKNLILWLLERNPCKRPTTVELFESELFQRLYKDFRPPVSRSRSRFSSNSM